MENNVHLGDGVHNEAISEANRKMQILVKTVIDAFFDYLEGKAKELPELLDKIPQIIEKIRNNPEVVEQITTLWSEKLYEKGLIPVGYSGLPDELLIHNFHQDGYLEGMYVGYILSMMALVDNEVSKDLILSIRDCVRPNLSGHSYDKSDEFTNKYNDERYRWIETAKIARSDGGDEQVSE